jgi:hypothetical protein
MLPAVVSKHKKASRRAHARKLQEEPVRHGRRTGLLRIPSLHRSEAGLGKTSGGRPYKGARLFL